MEIQVKAVHSGVEGKDGDGGGKLQHLESNETRQAVISRAKLSKTFPSYSRRLADNSLGGKAYKHSSMLLYFFCVEVLLVS